MAADTRYEILDQIASGEFAAVYRARDRELGREVAVKQIHAQYLADSRQLARYWQEAQLLATLQHPNIITIYDLVRPRGWLILELMRSSLRPVAEGDPIDLDFLRLVLVQCLQGLSFLHTSGVIHGDVKPSNILIGPQNRVKLGDFGLARRATNEEGSLLKGTTKYMAPELLSNQFGPIGPASDLYALGFTAYELMVGKHFESLLPTLATFGRNKQVAWMMWHSAVDVKLPEIGKVLEGVPPDLAHVIGKLITKDQSKRYSSAVDALRDLQTRPGLMEPLPDAADPEAEIEAAAKARRKKRLRILAGVVGALCVTLSVVMLAVLNRKPPPKPKPNTGPDRGVIIAVFASENRFGLAPADGGPAKPIEVHDADSISINDEPQHLLRELREHDSVTIERKLDEKSRNVVLTIHAFRPKSRKGIVQTIETAATFVLRAEESDGQTKDLAINVPEDLPILLNGQREFDGHPVQLTMLKPGDRAVVHFVPQENGVKATELEAERIVELSGTLAEDYDARNNVLSIITGSATQADGNRRVVKLPMAAQSVITINGQPVARANSLRKDDQVTLKHDTHVVEVRAQRTLGAAGIVQQIHYEPPQTLIVQNEGKPPRTYIVGPECKITLGDDSVTLEELRPGDSVQIVHAAVDPKSQDPISPTAINATRSADPLRWAIVIGQQTYDDAAVSQLPYAGADAKMLAEVLVKRYRISPEQMSLFSDESLVSLEQQIPARLKLMTAESRLLVYYTGQAVKDGSGTVYLAPKDFKAKDPASNGLKLQWLVDQMEECPAKEKLLLFDAGHFVGGPSTATAADEPSAADMIRSLKPQENRALLRTIIAVASCRKGQKSLELADKGHGLFGWFVEQGYSGTADTNHDTRVEPTELFSYLQKTMPSASKDLQSPELFLPDDRPPRLTAEAKQQIRRLAGYLGQPKIDRGNVEREFFAVAEAAKKEVEPRLIYGLLMMKNRLRDEAVKQFEEVKSEQPDRLLPSAALAWLRFDKRAYAAGVGDLTDMIGRIPKTPRSNGAEAKFLITWAGQMREFASVAVQDPPRLLVDAIAGLDAAVAAHGPEALELYQKGRQKSEGIAADFDRRIAAESDEATQKKLAVDRRQMSQYLDFPITRYKDYILSHLDD
jgi:serine/threonine-protein kinase